MKTLGHITRYIEATSSRLDDLAVRARSVTDVGRPLVQESLIHLASTLEELRVSEEELRSQADTLAASRSDVEAELRRYRDLFQQAPDAYLATDSEGVIREANHAAAALLGARPEYLAGKPLAVFVHEEDRRGFRRQLAWVRETQRLAGWQLRLVSRSGATLQLDASVSAAPVGNGDAELRWVLREAARRPAPEAAAPQAAAPIAEAPVPLAAAPVAEAPMLQAAVTAPQAFLQALPVEAEPADAHRMADPAWCEALLEEADRTVNPASRSSAERLAGLFRESLSLALYLGLLRAGDRIPGIREVSRATALNHKTVARAYRTLQKEGILEVRDRSGVYVGALGWTDRHPVGDTETWAAEVLTEAWRRRIGIPALPEVVRRWTAAAPLRCACVEADPERRAALCAELAGAFGFECVALAPDDAPGGSAGGMATAVAGADLVVTTPFHAAGLRPLARAHGRPLMVVTAAQPAASWPAGADAAGAPLPRLTLDTARSISETVVLLSLERAPDGRADPAGRTG
ncbi:MAG TPA: PAS domain-containing protein [Longimicrobiaceae bacterium]|nr:PAS domain-containing protein [Longimicrobiaceae bacterium]